MKKINYRRLVTVCLWVLSLAVLFLSWSFVIKKEGNTKAVSLNIEIANSGENQFVDEFDIKTFFEERNDKIVNNELKNIDINKLEKALNSHPAIENSEVSYDMNGDVKVTVTQRRPLVRIINADGESYYIDSLNKPMPLNYKSTANVLVANGYIFEPYARRYNFTIDQIASNKLFKEVSVLDDICQVAREIYADSLLKCMIHQIYVNSEKEIVVYPIIGNHSIIIGDTEDLTLKLKKLKLFYTQGLNKTDGWNKYSSINLKYKNLVVCTKK